MVSMLLAPLSAGVSCNGSPRQPQSLRVAHTRAPRLLSHAARPAFKRPHDAPPCAGGTSDITCATASSVPSPSIQPLSHAQSLERQRASAYLEMARPINLLPSMMLVLFGAWASTGRSLVSLRAPAVWLVSLLSSSVAAASMVVNDYFDFRSGADAVNSPQKPLPRGLVTPDGALLFGFVLYVGVLLATCFMGQPLLRTVIALSAAATLLYTPILKRLTGIKNATVAAVITASPLAGALAAGAGRAGIARLVPLCTFLFMGLMYREVLMDITDEIGDREAGVRTIPVVAGRSVALTVATLCVASAGSLLTYAALHGHGLAWAWASHRVSERAVRAAAMLSAFFLARPVAAAISSIWQSGFNKATISRAIDESMKSIGLGMIMLAAVV